MKVTKPIALSALLLTALLGSHFPTAGAQYYGANGSTWNNPMSASADLIIQQNMERQRLKASLRKKRTVKKPTVKKPTVKKQTAKKASRRPSSSRRTTSR